MFTFFFHANQPCAGQVTAGLLLVVSYLGKLTRNVPSLMIFMMDRGRASESLRTTCPRCYTKGGHMTTPQALPHLQNRCKWLSAPHSFSFKGAPWREKEWETENHHSECSLLWGQTRSECLVVQGHHLWGLPGGGGAGSFLPPLPIPIPLEASPQGEGTQALPPLGWTWKWCHEFTWCHDVTTLGIGAVHYAYDDGG